MFILDKSLAGYLARVALLSAVLLAIPLVAMQVRDDVVWTASDFALMGLLLFGTGLAYGLVGRVLPARHRVTVAIAFVLILLLVWAELAVGVFGTPFAGS